MTPGSGGCSPAEVFPKVKVVRTERDQTRNWCKVVGIRGGLGDWRGWGACQGVIDVQNVHIKLRKTLAVIVECT